MTPHEYTSSVAHCRRIVEDLRKPRPGLYALDIVASALIGWGLVLAAGVAGSALAALTCALGAAFALYRGLAFIHEMFHQQAMRGVRRLWHALIGVPLLLPLLLYLPIHQGHHSARVYGTREDGEYEQFKGRLGPMTLRLFAVNLLLPLALVVRFALLTPLATLFPVLRHRAIPEFVHLALRMPFRAPELKGPLAAESQRIEWACAAVAWLLIATLFTGQARWAALWAAVVFAVATFNTLRAICSTHLYVEADEGRDAFGQVLDSLNVDGGRLVTALLCPVGLRYHALHHLVPYLPYHALDEAHQRLMAELPADAAYRQVTVPSLYQGWQRLVDATKIDDSTISSALPRG